MLAIEELEEFFESHQSKRVWVFTKDVKGKTYYLVHLDAKTNATHWTSDPKTAIHFHSGGTANMHKDNYLSDRKDINVREIRIE